jgi:hypothetical protein
VLTDFARKYPMLKILKIPGDQCIEGYPDRLMPTILVYGPNEYRGQVVGLAELGGNNTRVPGIHRYCGSVSYGVDLERYAEKIGALGKAELRVTRDKDGDDDGRPQMRKSVINNDNDDEDDWD